MLKSLMAAFALLLAGALMVPASSIAGQSGDGIAKQGEQAQVVERRGRGGRNGSGRRPRTPGGSGCDSAEDIAEHPECR